MNLPVIGFPHSSAIVSRTEGINTPPTPPGNKMESFQQK